MKRKSFLFAGCLIFALEAATYCQNIILPDKDLVIEDVTINNTAWDSAIKSAFKKHKEKDDVEALSLLNNAINQAEGKIKGKLTSRLAYLKYYMKDDQDAEKLWKDIINKNIPASEKDICDAKLRIAYLKYKESNYEVAMEHFKDIATGIIPADYESARDAALRVAFLYRKKKDLNKSLDVFNQIIKKSSVPQDIAYAKLQVAGTLWELGKGDEGILKTDEEKNQAFLDSRLLCKELIEDNQINDSTAVEGSRIKIIAELIYIETYWFLKDYEQTVCLAENFLGKWTPVLNNMKEYDFSNPERPIRRQVITAQTWLAMAYYRVGRYQDCIEMCKKINSDFWKEDDPYKNFNVFGYAYLYEAKSLEALSKTTEAQKIRELIEKKYPQWYNVTAAYEEAKYSK